MASLLFAIILSALLAISLAALDPTLITVSPCGGVPNRCNAGDGDVTHRFEIDANFYQETSPANAADKGDDWDTILSVDLIGGSPRRTSATNDYSSVNRCTKSATSADTAAIFCDDIISDASQMDGGAKWINPLSYCTKNGYNAAKTPYGFTPKATSVISKSDIVDALAYSFLDTNANRILVNGFTRLNGNGDNFFAYEYNQFTQLCGNAPASVLDDPKTVAFQEFVVPLRSYGDLIFGYYIKQGVFTIEGYVLNQDNCKDLTTAAAVLAANPPCQYQTSSPEFSIPVPLAMDGGVHVVRYDNSPLLYVSGNLQPITVPQWGAYDLNGGLLTAPQVQEPKTFMEVAVNLTALWGLTGTHTCGGYLNVMSLASGSLSSQPQDKTGMFEFDICSRSAIECHYDPLSIPLQSAVNAMTCKDANNADVSMTTQGTTAAPGWKSTGALTNILFPITCILSKN